MIGIYIIKNKINNKVYVGQSIDIKKRWNSHKTNAFKENNEEYNKHLYRAIRKYGIMKLGKKFIKTFTPKKIDNIIYLKETHILAQKMEEQNYQNKIFMTLD